LKNTLKYTLLFLCSIVSTLLYAQEETVIAGQVLDKKEKFPIAHATVSFKNTNIITSTNEEGFFVLRSKDMQTGLVVSILGYKPEEINLKKGQSDGLQIELAEENNLLRDLIVFSGDNPALKFMHQVRINREKNNPENRKAYLPLAYEETQVSLNEISSKTIHNKLFKGIEKGALTTEDSSLLLPIFYSQETYLIENKQKKSLSLKQKSILPNQIELAKEFANKLPANINFYNNYITVFSTNFLSPLAYSSSLVYKYYIKDSLKIAGRKEYIIRFRPRNSKDMAFEGEMNIDSSSFALTKISATMPRTTNINFIHNLSFNQEYEATSSSLWKYKKQHILISLELINHGNDKMKNALFINKNTQFSDSILSNIDIDSINTQNTKFKTAIDTLNQTTIMRSASVLADIFLNRYIHIGKFDLGSITQLAAFNNLEGNRLTFSGRTGKKLWSNCTIGGYAGYGFRDETWKFGSEFQYRFKNADYSVAGFKYRDDVYQTDYDYHDEVYNENTMANGLAEIISTILQSFPEICSRRQISQLFFDHQWVKGINSHFALESTKFIPNYDVPFQLNGTEFQSMCDYRITLGLRFSYKERIMDEYFHRIFIGNKYPIVHCVIEAGRYDLNNSGNPYLKLHLMEKQNLFLGSIGKFTYSVEGGLLFGNVPFSLLEIYSGVKNYGYDKLNISLISLDQFASDTYLNFETRLLTNGVLFNYIPILNMLNLRELVSAKLACGTLRNSHLDIMQLPAYLKPMDAPYLVVGVGAANIFKIASVEYVMEMPRTTNPNLINWGLRFKLYVDF
jgi:hypothetical protein